MECLEISVDEYWTIIITLLILVGFGCWFLWEE